MRQPELRIHLDGLIVDSFAGGGGASLGIELATGRSPDIAINHDPEAIAMHRVNHPNTQHVTGDIWDANPAKLCAGRRVALAWFSPDCKHHSKAKGGKPVDKKIRGLAWVVVRWAKEVRPRIICLENVEEFQDWGPLLPDGRPCPERRGITFRRWLRDLKAQGYKAEVRQLRACDYGAPTIRKRLFVIARCDGRPIVWPSATHGPGTGQPHRAAAECIDWELPCPSIFERKKPLADKTLRRIARGIKRFVMDSAEPFIVPTAHAGDDRVHSIREPLRTITGAHRGDHALVAPLFARTDMHQSNAGCVYSPIDPLRTVTTTGGHALVAPTLIQTGYGERPGQTPRALDIQKPLGTVVSGGKHALVSAFLAKHFGGSTETSSRGGRQGLDLGEPISTLTARDHHSLVTAHMLKLRGTCADGQAFDKPAPTVTAGGGHLAEVRAFLTQYNGESVGQSPQLSLGTLTTKPRFGLVTICGEEYEIADVGLRMLRPRELFRAQGFPDSYDINIRLDAETCAALNQLAMLKSAVDGIRRRKRKAGEKLSLEAQIRMCGNSVSPDVAAALARCRSEKQLEQRALSAAVLTYDGGELSRERFKIDRDLVSEDA